MATFAKPLFCLPIPTTSQVHATLYLDDGAPQTTTINLAANTFYHGGSGTLLDQIVSKLNSALGAGGWKGTFFATMGEVAARSVPAYGALLYFDPTLGSGTTITLTKIRFNSTEVTSDMFGWTTSPGSPDDVNFTLSGGKYYIAPVDHYACRYAWYPDTELLEDPISYRGRVVQVVSAGGSDVTDLYTSRYKFGGLFMGPVVGPRVLVQHTRTLAAQVDYASANDPFMALEKFLDDYLALNTSNVRVWPDVDTTSTYYDFRIQDVPALESLVGSRYAQLIEKNPCLYNVDMQNLYFASQTFA